ncbi:RNA binding motif protein 12Ba [Clarias gariepinus]|uniref:RNA binding motif protein 12Ba n=1 Tax=Clarias gariepinus TaxID=13013 RepID=UPI00234D7F1D|nr:RNA binding motif protein 12Ba [Clarias gariepinus]
MAVIVRLHGLNIKAGSEDIRKFFHGLPIPEGGVHITGGKMGEAFIIFSSERAGQLAMLYSGKQLRGSTVTLYKSNITEFKNSLELKLRKRKCPPPINEPQTTPPTSTLEMCTTLCLGLVAMVQELQSKIKTDQELSTPVSTPDAPKSRENSVEKSPIPDQMLPVKNQVMVKGHHMEVQEDGEREVDSCKPGYLRIYGLPHTTTKEEVCQFLKGLRVVDVITDSLQGRDRCCLVKMASFKEAEDGLKYSHGPMDLPIEVRLAHERMWENAVERYENSPSSTFPKQEGYLHGNSPAKRPCSSVRSPKRRRSNSPTCNTEYCVMVKNLPKTLTKTEIKGLFSCPDLPNSKVLHLLDKWKERTSTAFIIFTQPEKFTLAMNMNGSVVDSQIIDVSSITMEKMYNLLYKSRCTEPERCASTQTRPVLSCIYARNFPAAVRRAEVKEFFSKYDISEEDIKLLKDKDGNRTGEACIQFGSEEHAREAHSQHRKHFKQEQILLTCITLQQMKDLLHKTHERAF